jgi:hypothetical protein
MPVTPNSAVTPQAVVTGYAKVTGANSNYAAPTNTVQLLAGQANGARLTSVTALALANTSAVELQLFSYDGTTYKFIMSKLMPTVSISGTTAQALVDFGYSENNPLNLAPNEQLVAAIGAALATGVQFRCQGGAY